MKYTLEQEEFEKVKELLDRASTLPWEIERTIGDPWKPLADQEALIAALSENMDSFLEWLHNVRSEAAEVKRVLGC